MLARIRPIFRRSARYWPLALLLLMLILRLIWGWSVHRQFNVQLSVLRARGQPIDPAQITHPAVPDDNNAVVVYRKAIAVLDEHVDCPRNSNLEYPGYFPRPARWMELAQASEKAQAPAFAFARAARQRHQAQFATSFDDQAKLRYLSQLRDLANVINDGAEYAHLRGNDFEALERIRDCLHLSRALAADDYLISCLVAMGVDSSACHSIMMIAPGLAAPLENIRLLIGELLDERIYRDAIKRTFINERVRQIHSYSNNAHRYWVLSPLAEQNLVRELPNLEWVIQAADAPDFPQARSILKNCQWDHPPQGAPYVVYPSPSTIPRYSRWFYDSLNYSPHIERFYRVLADRRTTAVSLACQLYRIDHGEFPQRLDQLVPTYLPAIPADPFSSDGRPIGYAIKTHAPPLSGPRPVLYFDPGGGNIVLKPEPYYVWYILPMRGAPVRQYRDISRFVPPPSTKTVNNNPYQSNAPGNDAEEDNGFDEP